MRASFATALCALLTVICNIPAVIAQQFLGERIDTPGGINNTLGSVPGAEITYWNIKDPNKKNATLINYSSLDENWNRLTPSNVQRVVIFVHGLGRDGGTYMSNMLSAMAQIQGRPDVNRSNVQIVCPVFPNGNDKNITYPWTNGLAPGKGSTSSALVWYASGWISGDDAQYPTNRPGVSSFLVLDQMVQYYDNKTLYPNLKQIVVAGHSAGAQNVHRYAAVGKVLNTKTPVTYWIANPNSYAWFSQDRPLDTSTCSNYDDWKEGLSNYPNTYANTTVMNGSDAGRAAVMANYNSKSLTYVRGLQDLGDDSSDCKPLPQGQNRNERFFYFIKRFPGPVDKTSIDYVNLGHDAGATMASSAGQARLFFDNFNGNGSKAYDFGCPRQQDGDNPNPDPTCTATVTPADQGTYNNFTYQGCYTDNAGGGGRTLPNRITPANTTIESCTAGCAAAGYTVAGIEFGDECYCGTALAPNTLGPLIEASCTMPCAGNSSQICGDSNRLSIFSIGNVTFQVKPVSPPVAGTYNYSGCWVDTGARVLQGPSQTTNDMTVEKCAAFCGAAGTNAFGVEYTSQCYCGDSFVPSSSLATATDCNMVCGGNSTELCGGPNRLNVYAINATMLTAGGSPSSTTSSSATSSATATATATSATATSTSTSLSCPGSDKTSYISNGTASYAIECFVDHAGGDLSSASVSSFSACIDTCTTTKGCIDVSFVAPNNCYMKSTLQPGVTASNVWGARFVSAVVPNVTTSTTSSSSSSSPTISSSTSSDVITSSSSSSSALVTPITNSTSSSTSSSSVPLTTTSSSSSSSALTTSSSTSSSSVPVITTSSSTSSSSSVTSSSSSSSSSVTATSSSTSSSSAVTTSSSTSSSAEPTTSSTSSSSSLTSSSSSSSSISTSSSSSSSSVATTSSSTSSSATTSSSTATTSSSTSSSSVPTTTSTSSATTSSTTTSSTSSTPTTSSSSTSQATTFSTITTTSSSSTTSSTTSSSSSTSSTIPLPSGYTPLGCYLDSSTPRTLPYQAYSNTSNTPSLCALACTASGYQFSGTEYSSECWCGSSLPSLTTPTAPSSDCSMACAGDKTQRCGAGNRLSVVSNSNAVPFGVPMTYGNWSAYGCLSDSVSSRTLANGVSLSAYGGTANATIENALDACAKAGYTWCGAEYYGEVYGAKKAPDASLVLAKAGDGQMALQNAGCSYKCKGNGNEACGGSNRIVVYSLSS